MAAVLGPETEVFPTGVGVNRDIALAIDAARSIPHRRGGEPLYALPYTLPFSVFPTGVGVNRGPAQRRRAGNAYSPQAWG